MTFLLVKSRIWEIFLRMESKICAMETGILLNEPGITLKVGIQDPLSQTKNKASSTWNVEYKILLHEAIRIVGKDRNEEGKICALTDMFPKFFFLLP